MGTVLAGMTACGLSDRDADDRLPQLELVANNPFPRDIEMWGCKNYLNRLSESKHQVTLLALLELRPHKQQPTAHPDSLIDLDPSLVVGQFSDKVRHGKRLHKDVVVSLKKLLTAANSEDIPLQVQSAYRSPSYQSILWLKSVKEHKKNLAAAAFNVAPPCFSEHATGKAVDLSLRDSVTITAESTAHLWLRENAPRYGWVQSFSVDTGAGSDPLEPTINLEPWQLPAHCITYALTRAFYSGQPSPTELVRLRR